MRRRYEVRFDPSRQRYVVEALSEDGQRREVEAYADWDSATGMRERLNQRLTDTGELLPQRRQ